MFCVKMYTNYRLCLVKVLFCLLQMIQELETDKLRLFIPVSNRSYYCVRYGCFITIFYVFCFCFFLFCGLGVNLK